MRRSILCGHASPPFGDVTVIDVGTSSIEKASSLKSKMDEFEEDVILTL